MKIKLLFSLCLISIFSVSAFSQSNTIKTEKQVTQVAETNKKVIWESKSYDFGSIDRNISANAEFVFTNNTMEPIVILKVKSSCGCTVTGYDKVPVLPGEKSTITATYNAKKTGTFRKNVTVSLSDNSQYNLTIKGVVNTNETITQR